MKQEGYLVENEILQTLYSHLRREIPKPLLLDRKGPGGKSLTYIRWVTAQNMLDAACDAVGATWDWKVDDIKHIFPTEVVTSVWSKEENKKVPGQELINGGFYVLGTVTINLPDGLKISRSGTGWSPLKPEGIVVDIGVKDAETDALKRAIVKFGPGKELYGDEGIPELEESSPDKQSDLPKVPKPASKEIVEKLNTVAKEVYGPEFKKPLQEFAKLILGDDSDTPSLENVAKVYTALVQFKNDQPKLEKPEVINTDIATTPEKPSEIMLSTIKNQGRTVFQNEDKFGGWLETEFGVTSITDLTQTQAKDCLNKLGILLRGE